MWFWLIFNFFMGIYTVFTLIYCIIGIIFAHILKKKSNNPLIREISSKSYDIYKKGHDLKSSVFPSVKNQLVEVSKLTNPDSSNPVLDLSINEVITGLFMLQGYLKMIAENPIFKDLKKLTIRQILSVEKVVQKPMQVFNSKIGRFARWCWSKGCFIYNILSPTLWVRRLLVLTLFKEGKKDIIISCYDVLGNTVKKIYTHPSKRENDSEDEEV